MSFIHEQGKNANIVPKNTLRLQRTVLHLVLNLVFKLKISCFKKSGDGKTNLNPSGNTFDHLACVFCVPDWLTPGSSANSFKYLAVLIV